MKNTNQMTITTESSQANNALPIAVTMPLQGQHIIEASAGTGKTWTLTGILLRLIVEEGYPCEKIIATTFTRAAATEMRERIRGRLLEMSQLLQLYPQALQNMAVNNSETLAGHALDFSVNQGQADVQSQKAIFNQFFEEIVNLLPSDKDAQDLVTEPIYQHILLLILKTHFANDEDNHEEIAGVTEKETKTNTAIKAKTTTGAETKSQKSSSTPNKTLDIRQANYRTNLALNQLDKLFVGTLDSLCQKWLREFSAETGFQPDIVINTDPQNIILNLVHDQLRGYRAWLATQEPVIFNVMFERGLLATATDFLAAIDKAMTFYATPIDEIVWQDCDIEAVNQLIGQINAADSTPLEPYLNADYRKKQGLNGQKTLAKSFALYPEILQQLQGADWQVLLELQETHLKWLEQVADSVNHGTGFNQNKDSEQQVLNTISLIGLFARLFEAQQGLQRHFDIVNLYFAQFISRYVKTQLPLILEAQHQTTFSLQLARLNEALASQQGAALARYIRHQYPIALIDESQDINTEQAMLLQHIYLTKNKKDDSHKMAKGFLLLVGDPKQAIYGFRGGDVNNYTQLKQQFNTPVQVLTQNFRSSKSLVNQLNHWFGVPDSQTDNAIHQQLQQNMPIPASNPYWLGEQIVYRHTQAAREQSALGFDGAIADKTMPADKIMSEETADLPAMFLLPVAYQAKRPIQQENDSINEPLENETLEEDTIDFSDVVAAQILALLSDDELRYQDDRLQMSDICVLGVTTRQIDNVEQKLHLHGVATARGGTKSIFADTMTQDMLILMQAMLFPYDITRLKSLLLTRLFGLDMAGVQAIFEQHDQQTGQNFSQDNTIGKQNSSLQNFTLETIQLLIGEAGKRWQQVGFLAAIQWLLNQQLNKPTLSSSNKQTSEIPISQSFWQRLAAHPDGERLLIDLRQLMDIISQQAKNLGEHQLIAWLQRMQAECPVEEWSVQQRLPSEDGVKLMTIHQSKGLEFPIVFVVGLDKKPFMGNDKYKLYLYSQKNLPENQQLANNSLNNRRLSAVPFLQRAGQFDKDFFEKIEKNDNFEEKLRLTYVAVTRAKDRLYIVAQGADKNYSSIPLNHWLEEKLFNLPERLQNIIPIININSLSKYLQPNFIYQPKKEKSLHTNAFANENRSLPDYRQWVTAITQTQFRGWSNTSFTALSKHLNHDKYDSAINLPDYDDMEQALDIETFDNENLDVLTVLSDEKRLNTVENQLLRFNFEKGTNAGTFLHTILELLPPLAHPPSLLPDETLPLTLPPEILTTEVFTSETFRTAHPSVWLPPKVWQTVIDRAVDNSHIHAMYRSRLKDDNYFYQDESSPLSPHHVALGAWLYNILHTPLLAAGKPIAAIPSERRYHELSFNMSLTQDFNIAGLNALLKRYDIPINLQSKSQLNHYWRYLRGEIDLVYQQGEQFFVVDYKSNYLGNQYADYHTTALETAMTEHGYWLQASIYQVALHRYLQLRLPNYAIKKHLGAVEYAFLRGMHPEQADMGRLKWQPEPEFIERLDELFGRAG